MALLDDLNWRYATKKMNGTTVPEEKIEYILEAARLAPTSSGLQPFEIIVISNPSLLAEIQKISFNQPQITGASHLLVFAAWDNYTEERVNEVFTRSNAARNLPDTATDNYRENLLKMYLPRTAETNFHHAAKQSYIAFATAIVAAAEQRVDATPMEGFEADALDELLDLRSKNLRSTTILPLGYRDADNDWLVNLKKVRKERDQFFSFIK